MNPLPSTDSRQQLHAAARAYQAQHRCDYATAINALQARERAAAPVPSGVPVSQERQRLNAAALAYQAQHGCDYGTAVRAVEAQTGVVAARSGVRTEPAAGSLSAPALARLQHLAAGSAPAASDQARLQELAARHPEAAQLTMTQAQRIAARTADFHARAQAEREQRELTRLIERGVSA